MTIGEKGLQNPWRETGFSFMIRNDTRGTKRNSNRWNYFRKLGHASTIDCVTLVHSLCCYYRSTHTVRPLLPRYRVSATRFWLRNIIPAVNGAMKCVPSVIFLLSFLFFGGNFNVACFRCLYFLLQQELKNWRRRIG